MADDKTQGVIVPLVDKHGEGEIEREYYDWEIVDEGRFGDRPVKWRRTRQRPHACVVLLSRARGLG